MMRNNCPFCNELMFTRPEYPSIACGMCITRVVDSSGDPIVFHTEQSYGGLVATHHTKTGFRTDKDMRCYIDGRECEGVILKTGKVAIKLV